MTRSPAKQSKHLQKFSTLAGPIKQLPKNDVYSVQFNEVIKYDNLLYRSWTRFVAYGALLITIFFCAVLFQPSHWIALQESGSDQNYVNWIMLGCLAFLQLFIITGATSATRSTIKAKDPVPCRVPKNLRVAFATTRAPGEPIEMVEKTLKAIKNISYRQGSVEAWLLDETNDDSLKELCNTLDVHYFSRSGIPEWNTTKPRANYIRMISKLLLRVTPNTSLPLFRNFSKPNQFYAAKSKHGNFNAWRAYLQNNAISYDILAGVDTDQVPLPNYLQRMLGYFRDPDVAYVVGPQVYGNYGPGLKGLVARWAESQASFFQSTIQRAGNDSKSAMFVGTNYAVRMSTLDQINGFQPCITEDMATGLAIHSKRNPVSGNRWKSVYTPDVLAIGEGPDYWGPYFTQQWRWAAGTFDTWRKSVWKVFWKLSPKAMIHYLLMLTYYPFTALTWLLAVVSSVLYLLTGATAIIAPWGEFVSLYLMAVVLQMSLYFWNRRYNVSPHESAGTFGTPGMIISTLTAPIYLSAFFGMLIGKKANFVVTTKGSSDNPDWIPAFKTHLQWGLLIIVSLLYGVSRNNAHPAMLIWALMLLVICFTPIILGMKLAIPHRLRQSKANQALKPKEV
jgi:cellulose synthase/poly-beta-1,6-N-acetylglucosamine synthase-like glycosyltransferase